MKTPKYLMWTDHKAGYNKLDVIKGVESKKILDAMEEIQEICKNDEHLYCVCVFEKIPKTNDYVQILRSENGFSFHKESSLYNIRRYFQKSKYAKVEWFEFVEK